MQNQLFKDGGRAITREQKKGVEEQVEALGFLPHAFCQLLPLLEICDYII